MTIDHAIRPSTGPILSDGTTIDDLIDLERREVALRVLSDPEIYELEMQRLFAKAWVVVGHESEIPNSGDFVMRYLGEDSVIVARDRNGHINVSLNVCTHRGMQICREELGNQERFTCPYHAWSFDNTGRFLGAPYHREMYGDSIDRSMVGLRQARVGTYAGLMFATFDEAAPALDDYLGDIRWYLDVMYARTDAGMEVLGPPQRYVIDANWKTASEQSAADGYHTVGLHRSLMELGFLVESESGTPAALYGVDVGTPEGHALRCFDMSAVFTMMAQEGQPELSAIEKLMAIPPIGMTTEMVPQLERNLSSGQISAMADAVPFAGGLFPNVLVTSFFGVSHQGPVPNISFHAYVPKGPGRFEFWNWVLVEKDAPAEIRELAKKGSALNLGSSGVVEADDSEAWPAQQRSARGVYGRQEKMRYPALLGVIPKEGFEGPGLVYAGMTKDDGQWNWWLRWRQFMLGEA